MAAFKELFGTSLVGKDGNAVDAENLKDMELIGVYFSAHWCPPCRGFTPQLVECYNKLKAAGKKFEVIFVSSDRDEQGFKEYYDGMPWLAVSFADRDRKGALCDKYGVNGIPTLIMLKNDGSAVSAEGRGLVSSDPNGEKFPWVK